MNRLKFFSCLLLFDILRQHNCTTAFALHFPIKIDKRKKKVSADVFKGFVEHNQIRSMAHFVVTFRAWNSFHFVGSTQTFTFRLVSKFSSPSQRQLNRFHLRYAFTTALSLVDRLLDSHERVVVLQQGGVASVLCVGRDVQVVGGESRATNRIELRKDLKENFPSTHRSMESRLLLMSKSPIKSSDAIESHGDKVSNDPDRSNVFRLACGEGCSFNVCGLCSDLNEPCELTEISLKVGVSDVRFIDAVR